MNLNKLILSLLNTSETIEGVLQSGDATYKVDRVEIDQDKKSIKGINFFEGENIVYELKIDDINNLYTTLEYIEQTDEIPYNNRVTFKVEDGQKVELYTSSFQQLVSDSVLVNDNYLIDKIGYTVKGFARMVNGGIQ